MKLEPTGVTYDPFQNKYGVVALQFVWAFELAPFAPTRAPCRNQNK